VELESMVLTKIRQPVEQMQQPGGALAQPSGPPPGMGMPAGGMQGGGMMAGPQMPNPDELQRLLLPPVGPFGGEVPRPTHGKVSAWRVRYHQVPSIIDYVEHIAPIVRAGRVSWQKVAAHSVMACPDKGIPHSARILASDKDSHSINAPAIISEHSRQPSIASVSLVLSFMLIPLSCFL
jgi:hypothetical protein